jgi:eukaryotic-like serine/threonine-protein kinase
LRGARDQDLPARGLRHRRRPQALARPHRPVAVPTFSATAVAGSRVVVPSPSGCLYAHDVTTGKRFWRADLPVTDSAPAIANGVVYVGSGDGNLYAFGLKDRKQLWSARLGQKAVTSSPTVVNGAVYVGSDDGNVVAFRRR